MGRIIGGLMNYFQSHSLPADAGVVAAWDSEIARANEIPSLARLIAERGAELYPEFAKRYAEVRALPRSARRALQRRLAASRELASIPAEWQRRLAYSIAGAALLLVLSDGPLQAATITVGPGCTLTQAILSANYDTSYGSCTSGVLGPDTIVIPAGSKIILNGAYPGPYSATGLPNVTTEITINGNGSSISRSKKGPAMRLMTVGYTGDLTLNNLTLSAGYSYYGGGAIYNAGILEVNNCTFSGNIAYGGGAISNAGSNIYNTNAIGSATITGTTFTKNAGYQYGGGVYNVYGTMDIHNSTITGNRSYIGGGATNGYQGEMEIENSTISKNSAYIGGGISNYNGKLTIDPTTITGNKAYLGGGIATSYGSVYVDDSTIVKNSSRLGGGGIASFNTALYVYNSSLITGNKGGRYGGGVLNCGTFTLTNSTITTNSAKVAGGGVANISGTYGAYTCTAYFKNNGNVSGNKAKFYANIFDY
jgi:hypothetical protein